MTIIVDGKKIADEIENKIKKEILRTKIVPSLASVLVGNDKPSKRYAKLIQRASARVGIHFEIYKFPENISEKELIDSISSLNKKDSVDGILLHVPLPEDIDERKIFSSINPEKDIEGVHPLNRGKMYMGIEDPVPCVAEAVIRVLNRYNVEICGKDAIVIGHSNTIGKPISALLLNRNATVTVCHEYTKDLRKYTEKADIIVSATGVKDLIREDMVREGAIVIDVGRDIDFKNVSKKVSLITPPFGGIGPVTVSILMEHTYKLAKKKVI